ncbi:protoglobin domain-containing protein [Enhygromyxa salina]|nr:protoglobin domain-containing protein [Enhygromyxa salina]
MELQLKATGHTASSFFDEVAGYVGFCPADSLVLREFLPLAEPHFERISEHFYERIVSHPMAHQTITGGAEQIARLKRTLVEWMRSGLEGPHDEEFCRRRARIGHIHVRIGLPQRYMVTAMSVMRLDISEVANQALANDSSADKGAKLERLKTAIDRLCDIELSIMLETYKVEVEDRLRRRERLATIGQIAASIGHDLRNPLSVMESSLYILRRRFSEDPRAVKHVEKIAHQIDECDAIITHLLDMARNQPPRREVVAGADLLDAAIAAARVPKAFVLEREGFANLQLWVDGGLLKQALVNLFMNSVQAQRGGPGGIYVNASVDGANVTISVTDRGPGFELDNVPKVFEPLVTTKPSGTGLGLALVKSVTERHGGLVSATNAASGGAQVKIYLPGAVPGSASSAAQGLP